MIANAMLNAIRSSLIAATAAIAGAATANGKPDDSSAATAHAKAVQAASQLRYPETGKPLFASQANARKSVVISGLRRWRASAESIVFDTYPGNSADVFGEGFDQGSGKGVGEVIGTITRDESRPQGAGPEGRLRLFAPGEVDLGSSIAHWDAVASPNLLMEPSINRSLIAGDLDITPQFMFDIGWSAGTSTFTFTTTDPTGTGFNDNTGFSGAPGNDAQTLGQARRNVFERAAEIWGATLQSNVPIDVIVSYADLTCDDEGTTLAGATSLFQFSDDSSATMLPVADLVFPGPLVEALAGADLTGPPSQNGGDISVTVNSAVDDNCAGDNSQFYYGLDGNEPPGQFDLLAVILHELGHGLGFQNFANLLNGRPRSGTPSIYDLFTFDISVQKNWAEMTAGERISSATNTGNVVWTGPGVTAVVDDTLGGTEVVRISGNPVIDGDYDLAYGSIGSGPPADDITGPVNCILDASGDLFDGCEPAVNDLTDQVAFVRRGSCFFTTKATNAEAVGAKALVIVNNVDDVGVPPGGDLSIPINIPVAGMGQTAGEAIINETCSTDSPNRLLAPTLTVDASLACPGFYVGRVDAIDSEGRWNMEILLTAGRRLLQGGLNLGGGFEGADRPGFAAFNIANANNEPQLVEINMEVNKPASMTYQIDIVRREGEVATPVFSMQETASTAQLSQALDPGFYSVRVFGVDGTGVQASTFNLALRTRFVDRAGGAFQGGVNLGGLMTESSEFATTRGFGAICIDEAQVVSFETTGGAGAVNSLSLKVLDAARNTIAETP